jgi:hypothetical protein
MRGVKPCGREQKAENLSFSKPRISRTTMMLAREESGLLPD